MKKLLKFLQGVFNFFIIVYPIIAGSILIFNSSIKIDNFYVGLLLFSISIFALLVIVLEKRVEEERRQKIELLDVLFEVAKSSDDISVTFEDGISFKD